MFRTTDRRRICPELGEGRRGRGLALVDRGKNCYLIAMQTGNSAAARDLLETLKTCLHKQSISLNDLNAFNPNISRDINRIGLSKEKDGVPPNLKNIGAISVAVWKFVKPTEKAAGMRSSKREAIEKFWTSFQMYVAAKAKVTVESISDEESLKNAVYTIVSLDQQKTQSADIFKQESDARNTEKRGEAEVPKTIEGLFARFNQSHLAKHILPFHAKLERWTTGFVGRKFVFEAIDGLLKAEDFPCGYIIILGEPGIGKTALMADFVRRKRCVHHFNIAVEGSRGHRGIPEFCGSVCAQLIALYGLSYAEVSANADRTGEAGSKFLEESNTLKRLLDDVSSRDVFRPVVIAVDALDEAEDANLSPNSNRLCLPDSLPAGVFIVVSMRKKHGLRLNVKDSRVIDLDAEEYTNNNKEDASEYVGQFLKTHAEKMRETFAQWKVKPKEFSEILVRKSENNFMYLVHVLEAIRHARLDRDSLNDIEKLPNGLLDYYERHWRMMDQQLPVEFQALYKPVVCTLGAAKEAVSSRRLASYCGISESDVIKVLSEWREFFNEQPSSQGEVLYRLYHLSFLEFLMQKVSLAPFKSRIADSILKQVPGWLEPDGRLPG